jgi:hypothetical protein
LMLSLTEGQQDMWAKLQDRMTGPFTEEIPSSLDQ